MVIAQRGHNGDGVLACQDYSGVVRLAQVQFGKSRLRTEVASAELTAMKARQSVRERNSPYQSC